jgi:hypothetical protein
MCDAFLRTALQVAKDLGKAQFYVSLFDLYIKDTAERDNSRVARGSESQVGEGGIYQETRRLGSQEHTMQ